MMRNKLGSTEIEVSCLGLGTVKFGRNQGVKYPKSFELPDDHTILALLSCAQDNGINLLDTAPAYGNSEECLGKLLKSARHEWVLCTKAGENFIDGQSFFDFSPAAIRHSVEQSLKRLCTDYLDMVLIHSNGEDKKIIEENNVFTTLSDLKQSGHIRAFGMSTKTVEGGLLAVEQSDVVMVTYHPAYVEEQAVIAAAYQQKKGILIKKALMSGHIEKLSSDSDPVQAAMQFIFREQGVSSVIVGTLNKEHLLHNISCVVAK